MKKYFFRFSSPVPAFTDDDVPIPSSIVNPNAKFEFFSADDNDVDNPHHFYGGGSYDYDYDEYDAAEDEDEGEAACKRKLLPSAENGKKHSRDSSLASLDAGFKHPAFPAVPSGARITDSPYRTHG